MRRIVAAIALLSASGCPSRVNTATDVLVGGQARTGEPPPPSPPPSSPLLPTTPTPTPAPPSGPVYLLRDTGKRCFAAPCPSWAAVDVESRAEREITGVDLTALGLDEGAAAAAREEVLAGKVWVRGEIRRVPKQGPAGDGTVLFVTARVKASELR